MKSFLPTGFSQEKDNEKNVAQNIHGIQILILISLPPLQLRCCSKTNKQTKLLKPEDMNDPLWTLTGKHP